MAVGEHLLIFSFVSLLVIPWALALSLVDHLFQVYTDLTVLQFAIPVLFGAGWASRRYSSGFRFSVWALLWHTPLWSD